METIKILILNTVFLFLVLIFLLLSYLRNGLFKKSHEKIKQDIKKIKDHINGSGVYLK